jgi:predicted restriction endonuclease
MAGNILRSPTPHVAPEPALVNRRIALCAAPLPDFPFDSSDDEDAREIIVSEIYRRRGRPQFRQQLLHHYDRRCAISGCTVVELLEACHIKRYMGPRTNHPCNGILLRADLHTLFDLGLISIDTTEMSILVSAKLEGTEYESLRGQKIRLPVNEKAAPSVAALDAHRSRNFDDR